MARFVSSSRVVLHEHADHARERAGHVDLAHAEQRHALEADRARRDGRELRVEVVGHREDAVDDVARRERVAVQQLAHQLLGRVEDRARARWPRRLWPRAGRAGAWRRHHASQRLSAAPRERARPRAGAQPARCAPPPRPPSAQRPEARCARSARTGWPTASHIRRTWRLRPSRMRQLELAAAEPARPRPGAVCPSSSSTPSRRRCSAPSRTRGPPTVRAVGLRDAEARMREPVARGRRRRSAGSARCVSASRRPTG